MRKLESTYTFWSLWRSVVRRGLTAGIVGGGLLGLLFSLVAESTANFQGVVVIILLGCLFGLVFGIIGGAIDGIFLAVPFTRPNFRPDLYITHRYIFCALSALVAAVMGVLCLHVIMDDFMLSRIGLPFAPWALATSGIAAVGGFWAGLDVQAFYGANGKGKRKKAAAIVGASVNMP